MTTKQKRGKNATEVWDYWEAYHKKTVLKLYRNGFNFGVLVGLFFGLMVGVALTKMLWS